MGAGERRDVRQVRLRADEKWGNNYKMPPPITLEEILLEEYLEPMDITQNTMARAIGVSLRSINEIVLGKRSVTPAMSIRFGAFFSQSPEFWQGIQLDCDLRSMANKA